MAGHSSDLTLDDGPSRGRSPESDRLGTYEDTMDEAGVYGGGDGDADGLDYTDGAACEDTERDGCRSGYSDTKSGERGRVDQSEFFDPEAVYTHGDSGSSESEEDDEIKENVRGKVSLLSLSSDDDDDDDQEVEESIEQSLTGGMTLAGGQDDDKDPWSPDSISRHSQRDTDSINQRYAPVSGSELPVRPHQPDVALDGREVSVSGASYDKNLNRNIMLSADSSIDQLKQAYEARGVELDQLHEQVVALRTGSERQLGELRHKLVMSQAECDSLKEHREQSQKLLADQSTRLSAQAAEFAQIKNLFEKAKQDLRKSEAKTKSCEETIKSLQQNVSELQSADLIKKSRDMNKKFINDLQSNHVDEINNLKRKLTEHVLDLEKEREKSLNLETEMESSKQLQDRIIKKKDKLIKSLEQELNEKQQNLELVMQGKNYASVSHTGELLLDKIKDKNTVIATLRKELDDKRSQCGVVEFENKRLKLDNETVLKKANEVKAQMKGMKDRIDLYETALKLGVFAANKKSGDESMPLSKVKRNLDFDQTTHGRDSSSESISVMENGPEREKVLADKYKELLYINGQLAGKVNELKKRLAGSGTLESRSGGISVILEQELEQARKEIADLKSKVKENQADAVGREENMKLVKNNFKELEDDLKSEMDTLNSKLAEVEKRYITIYNEKDELERKLRQAKEAAQQPIRPSGMSNLQDLMKLLDEVLKSVIGKLSESGNPARIVQDVAAWLDGCGKQLRSIERHVDDALVKSGAAGRCSAVLCEKQRAAEVNCLKAENEQLLKQVKDKSGEVETAKTYAEKMRSDKKYIVTKYRKAEAKFNAASGKFQEVERECQKLEESRVKEVDRLLTNFQTWLRECKKRFELVLEQTVQLTNVPMVNFTEWRMSRTLSNLKLMSELAREFDIDPELLCTHNGKASNPEKDQLKIK